MPVIQVDGWRFIHVFVMSLRDHSRTKYVASSAGILEVREILPCNCDAFYSA
jgi:hypothetical protein